MGIFDDHPFITTRPGVYPEPTPLQPGELVRGAWWSLMDRGGAFALEYMSGQLDGRSRELALTPEEAAAVRQEGEAAADRIIRLHGGG